MSRRIYSSRILAGLIERGQGDRGQRNPLKVYRRLHLLSIWRSNEGANSCSMLSRRPTQPNWSPTTISSPLTVISNTLTLARLDLKKRVRRHPITHAYIRSKLQFRSIVDRSARNNTGSVSDSHPCRPHEKRLRMSSLQTLHRPRSTLLLPPLFSSRHTRYYVREMRARASS